MSALELACTGSPTEIDVGRMDISIHQRGKCGLRRGSHGDHSSGNEKGSGRHGVFIMGFVKVFQPKSYKGRLILLTGS